MTNLLDVDIKEEKENFKHEDHLKTIFELQQKLMNKYNVKKMDINTKEGQRQLKEMVFCMLEESFELTNALKNRAWVQTPYPVDLNRLYDEVADILHFYIEVCILLDLNSEKLYELYLKKYKVNKIREETKY